MSDTVGVEVEITIRLEFSVSVPESAVKEYREYHGMPGPFHETIIEIDDEVAEREAKEFLADRILYDTLEAAKWIVSKAEITGSKLER